MIPVENSKNLVGKLCTARSLTNPEVADLTMLTYAVIIDSGTETIVTLTKSQLKALVDSIQTKNPYANVTIRKLHM